MSGGSGQGWRGKVRALGHAVGRARAGARRWRRALVEDVWDVELSGLSAVAGLGVRTVRVVHMVLKGFREDECPLHASALTYSSLMSVVPVLALSLALVRGLGDAETAKLKIQGGVEEWTRTFSTQSVTNLVAIQSDAGDATNALAADALGPSELAAQINEIVGRGFEQVEKISFTAIGGIGLVLLLWMVIQVLGRVESSFNRVWGVSEGRSFWRKITDHLSMLFILPLLALVATSLPVADFATRYLDDPTAETVRAFLGSGTLKVFTVMVSASLAFALMIMFMPNTRVRLVPGLTGGVVTALLFIGWLRLCAWLQVGVARQGRIYGSFAVVPIVLAWVYVSWQIVLFGAEVAFALQNCATYRMERGAHRASAQSRVTLALAVILEAARHMLGQGAAFEVAAFARSRTVPVRFLNDIVDELTRAGLLAELGGREGAYVLLRSPDGLRVEEVIDAIYQSGVPPDELGLDAVDPLVGRLLAEVKGGLGAALAGRCVRDLLGGE